MAAISTHPYGVFEEETYAGDRHLFFCQQDPSIYQQLPQQYTAYPTYPIIHDQSWPVEMDMEMEMGMEMDVDMGMSNCWIAPAPAPSQPEPSKSSFLDPQQFYTYEYFEPEQYQQYPPLSPITPAASPYLQQQQDQYLAAYQFNTFPQEQFQLPLPQEESPHPSPYSSVPSLTASPTQQEEEEEEGEDDEEEEEEQEKELDASVIPNCGNKELRGMGLYDDRPRVTSFTPSSPGLLGRGLVLEQSFGLPEKMMIKDEETGDIIEGRLCVDDDEEEDEEEEDY